MLGGFVGTIMTILVVFFTGMQTINSRFEAIDRRFEAIDRRFEAIDRRFAAIEDRLLSIEEHLRNPGKSSKDSVSTSSRN